jgi:hypothetical protein
MTEPLPLGTEVGITSASAQGATVPVSVASLIESARAGGERGFRARRLGQHADAAAQLGGMVEHLAKAYLVSLHPTLITGNSPFDFWTLAQLAGHGTAGERPLKTVGLREALRRIAQIRQLDDRWVQRFNALFDVRNDAVHLGQSPKDEEVYAQQAVLAVDLLLDWLGRDLRGFLGRHIIDAHALLEGRRSAVQRRVERLIAEAKGRFEQRFHLVSHPERQAAILSAAPRIPIGEEDNQRLWDCPSCGEKGVLVGQTDVAFEVVTYLDEQGHETGLAEPDRLMLEVEKYRCPHCELSLVGVDELGAAGLPTAVPLRAPTEADMNAYWSREDERNRTVEATWSIDS